MNPKNLKKYLSILKNNQIEFSLCMDQTLVHDLANFDFEHMTFHQVAYDSKDVTENCFFICKGNNFKLDYLLSAIQSGAKYYLSDTNYNQDIPGIIVSELRKAMFLLVEYFYDYPQKDLKFIGITGTKGKSTTTLILAKIFEEVAKKQDAKPAGVISSIYNYDGFSKNESSLTTPEPIELFEILNNCKKAGLEYVLIEASSQALKYDRLMTIHFDTAIFLNLGHDHISPIEHPSFEDYFASKLKIIDQAEHVFIDKSLLNLEDLSLALKTKTKIKTFSVSDSKADYYLKSYRQHPTRADLDLKIGQEEVLMTTNLFGEFNAQNILAALSVADFYQLDFDIVKNAIQKATIPGRMEILHNKSENILCLIDFAHNEMSFKQVFTYTKHYLPNFYQIAVFGSVGGKAKNRRQGLGNVAGAYADLSILTEDNSNTEDQHEINLEIIKSIEKHQGEYLEIFERQEAIFKAFDLAKDHYSKTKQKVIILLLGRGIEDEMTIKGKSVPYPSDIDIAKKALAELN